MTYYSLTPNIDVLRMAGGKGIYLNRLSFILIKLVVLVLFFSTTLLSEAMGEEGNSPEHVFIISVDGLNYEGLISTPTPNIESLAGEGVIDEKSLALRVDTLEAAEASLLTGAFPEEHQHYAEKDKLEVESLLEALNKKDRSLLFVDGSGGKLSAFAYGEKEYLKLESNQSDQEVFEQTIKRFNELKPFFTYVYLNDCREALLSLDEKAYYKAIKSVDEHLGDFVNYLRKEKLFYNSLIIVTSSRSSSPSHLVPLIIHGPDCKSGEKLGETMVIDIVPTVCNLCGFNNLYNSRGICIYDALMLNSEDMINLSEKWITDYQKDRIRNQKRYFELEDEMDRTLRRMASIKEEKDSIFDFAGKKEKNINKLKLQITMERLIFLIIILLMLFAYILQYRWLKKKFLLFK